MMSDVIAVFVFHFLLWIWQMESEITGEMNEGGNFQKREVISGLPIFHHHEGWRPYNVHIVGDSKPLPWSCKPFYQGKSALQKFHGPVQAASAKKRENENDFWKRLFTD